MAVQLEHPFTTAKPIDESFATITDLEQVVPCVEGGSVVERTGDDSVAPRSWCGMGADVDDVHRHRRGHGEDRTPARS